MEYINLNASKLAYEYLQESTSSLTSEELNSTFQKAIAAPALANAALLAANGCTTTFISVVSALYMSNDLPIPDFSELKNISHFQMEHKANTSCCGVHNKTNDLGSSQDTVDFTGINEELKVFNSNFYTITETSPPDWEDWFDEDNHSNMSFRPPKNGSLSSGISVNSLASASSSTDVSTTSCNVSMINPPTNSLRHSLSSGISLASFSSSNESLDIPNVSQSSKLPFSSTPLPSELRAALSPRKLALAHSLNSERKRHSMSPKKAMPQFKDLDSLHRHILSLKMVEASKFRYSNCNLLSLSPKKPLTPFTTPSDVPRYLKSSKVPVSLTPLSINMESNSLTQESFKSTNSRTFDSTPIFLPSINHTSFASPSSFRSGTFDLTTDTSTSPWVVIGGNGAIDPDINITKDLKKETFEDAAKKMWQRCRRTQLF
ncbi:unnamed protein product [Meganyctiphanes norvegica]|uniref:Uncharacterized protein n=1 Tax=Meganyctiphanes norvegica TaxID=48144 RepID=A0AAV2QNA3_MEGNR